MVTDLIECVPNVSEGVDLATLTALERVLAASGLRILHRDVGIDANRTVYTIVGTADQLARGIPKFVEVAAEKIDLRTHVGCHPRVGAVDVCPLIPLGGTSTSLVTETVGRIGAEVGTRLGIPVILYEHSAATIANQSLAAIRRGGTEALSKRLATGELIPDFGPPHLHATAGALVLGHREFLIAWNVTLEPISKALPLPDKLHAAKRLATQIRERSPAGLARVRAIGWNMPEYNAVQVSCNLLNYKVTGFKTVYDRLSRIAPDEGLQVVGSELIGLVPLDAFVDSFPAPTVEESVALGAAYLRLSCNKVFVAEGRVLEWVL